MYRILIDSDLNKCIINLLESIHSSICKLTSASTEFAAPSMKNVNKLLVKRLKELGHGSWSQGVLKLQHDMDAIENLATMLEVTGKILHREAFLNLSLPSGLQNMSDMEVRKEECLSVFHEYFHPESEAITSAGFEKFFLDANFVGCHDCDTDDVGPRARRIYVSLDTSFNDRLSYEDFEGHYIRKEVSIARCVVRMVVGLSLEAKMRKVFHIFASFGASKKDENARIKTQVIDSFRYSKLCREAEIVTSGFQLRAIDIIFSKCSPIESKKMTFDHFLISICHLEVLTRHPMLEICKKIANCKGPETRSTKADYIKLHDDKSLFTGVYGRGGPSLGPVNLDMKLFVNRGKVTEKPTSIALEITQPESPTLATTARIASPGPVTPGRGASLEACEARKARTKEDKTKTNRSPAAFGRSMDHIAPARASPNKTDKCKSGSKGIDIRVSAIKF